MYLSIVEFNPDSPVFDEDTATLRLVGRTGDDKRIVFWGTPEEGTRNIDALKGQKLPVVINIEPEECIPQEYEHREFNTAWSVPAHAWVTIHPEF